MSDKNKFEIHLLKTDIGALVSHYQSLIEIIVSKFIRQGFFRAEEKMDLVQSINTSLLEGKMEKVRQNFNGSVYLSTYVSKVIYNLCLEKNRSRARIKPVLDLEQFHDLKQNELSAHDQLVLRDELLRLEGILKSIFKQRTKSLICLKIFSRVPLNDEDLGHYRSADAKHELAMVRTTFFDPFDNMTDKDAYHVLSLLFNKIDLKSTDSDSLRKWVSLLLDKMVRLLNGDPPRARHTRETLKTLLQMYFSK